MIIMMKLAFHPANTYWLRATLQSLITVKESDLPQSGSVAKHASLLFYTLATKINFHMFKMNYMLHHKVRSHVERLAHMKTNCSESMSESGMASFSYDGEQSVCWPTSSVQAKISS